MNTLARFLQVLLGLWFITGGVYFTQNHLTLLNSWASSNVPSFVWIIYGVLEVALGLGLIVTVGKGKLRKCAPIFAITMAILPLLGIPLFTSFAGFPGVLWPLIPALLLAFVAYERSK